MFENKFKSKILLRILIDYLLKSSYLCNVNERGKRSRHIFVIPRIYCYTPK